MRKIFSALVMICLALPAFADCQLVQSTAVTLKMGPFLDSGDGLTPETALTLTQADFRLAKNGGNMAQKSDATSATHDEIGMYDVPFNTTDTNTLGLLRIDVQESGALPVWADCIVTAANWTTIPTSIATAQTDLDTLTGTDGATLATAQALYAPSKAGDAMALTAAAVDLVWDEIVEDTGATYTARCAFAIGMAYGAGVWTQAGSVITYQDPGGNENRIVGTVQSPGFDTITLSCP